MQAKIRNYINSRYDNDGVLPDADEVYLAFQVEFDNGYPTESIDEVMEDFVRCHDLSGIQIEWEGELRAVCNRGFTEKPIVPSKTA